MANLFGGALLHAREGSYFKSEQEGDLERYLRKKVKSGEIVMAGDGKRLPGGAAAGGASAGKGERVFEVDMKILQQKSRVDTEKNARDARRKVKGLIPLANEHDRARIARNLAMYGTTGFVTSGARVSLSRSWDYAAQSAAEEAGAAAMASHQAKLSPEAREAMRRQFVAGARALAYGSALSVVIVAAGCTAVSQWAGADDGRSLRDAARRAFAPLAASAASLVRSYRPRAQGGEPAQDSEFRRQLRERFAKLKEGV